MTGHGAASGSRAEKFLEICQLPVSARHTQVGDPAVADSILDRLVHNAHRIELQGESMRKKQAAGKGSSRAEDPA
jgi:DNA replication protein DnaC